ncbi:hypothetical protein DLAC_01512 [Tieghemostelium lacteum]|uniref:Glutathione S-transferase n=1 Tax=Tieghemostelium lacteum TaxID=361077 RepID=A0A152A5L1_TIELA|nr:hypothetical protein DLAC_01512 [Tieghemostelium lacteum]|eukprot:KYR01522.1 hypothetical protein DLAC_01512 [Tieghemostelium lacteum]
MVLALLPITGTYASILAGFYVYLSVDVIKERLKVKCLMGDGSQSLIRDIVIKSKDNSIGSIDIHKYEKMYASIRAHSNFFEYVPLVLTLSAIMELNQVSPLFLKSLMGVFTIARIAHNQGIKKDFKGVGRTLGAVTTFGTIAIATVTTFYLSNKTLIDSYLFA